MAQRSHVHLGRRADSLRTLGCYGASLLGNEVGPEPSEAYSKLQITHSGTNSPPGTSKEKQEQGKSNIRVYFTCNLKELNVFDIYQGQGSVLDKSNLVLFSPQTCQEEMEVQKS